MSFDLRGVCVATALSLVFGCASEATPSGTYAPDGRETEGSQQATPTAPETLPPPGDPLSDLSVYWVGHSLMDGIDTSEDGALNIMGLVGHFAASRDEGYAMFPHTRPGSPLSENWYWRHTEPLEEIRERGHHYDVMVITEAVPLDPQIEWNASDFFARRFFCAAKMANPDMRFYVYETWHHRYASWEDGGYPPPHTWDWRGRLSEDLSKWEAVAAAAATGDGVDTPEAYAWTHSGEDPAGDCTVRGTVGIVPVGQALAALYDRLQAPPEGEDWGDLRIDALFLNGYTDWPQEWPVSEAEADSIDPNETIAGLTLYHPSLHPDDIHLSALGTYYAALVHYATLYRRSPVGLPPAQGVASDRARLLQELAWEVVREDPRTGVAP
jgi:hypothetical protein